MVVVFEVVVTVDVVNDGLQVLHLFLECVDKSSACGSISVAVTMVLMKLLQNKKTNIESQKNSWLIQFNLNIHFYFY